MSPTETLFEGQYLRLLRRGRWEYVSRQRITGIVAIAGLTRDDQLVLIEQFRAPLGRRVVELPAGLAGDVPGEEHEPLEAAAQRELLEETGFSAERFERVADLPSSAGLTSETVTLFVATDLRRAGEGGGDGTEDITTHLVPWDDVDPFIAAKVAEGCLVDAKLYVALWMLSRRREGKRP